MHFRARGSDLCAETKLLGITAGDFRTISGSDTSIRRYLCVRKKKQTVTRYQYNIIKWWTEVRANNDYVIRACVFYCNAYTANRKCKFLQISISCCETRTSRPQTLRFHENLCRVVVVVVPIISFMPFPIHERPYGKILRRYK